MANIFLEYHILYLKSIKSFKVRRKKNLLLCRMLKKAHGKFITLLCAKRKKIAVRQNKAHGKAKQGYVVCPIFIVFFLDDTWQKSCLPCA